MDCRNNLRHTAVPVNVYFTKVGPEQDLCILGTEHEIAC